MKKLQWYKKAYLVAFFSFMYLPIAVMIAYSFNENKSRGVFTSFSVKWYANLFENEAILQSLVVSLLLAAASAVLATILGTMASLGINNMKSRSRSVVLSVSYVPVINPEIVTGVSMMLLFVVFNEQVSSILSGILNTEVSYNGFGMFTLLIAHITFCVPYVIFTVSPKLRQMDIRVYEAALDLGCNHKQAFFKVILPEIMPAIFSSFLICLTYSIDDFVISYFTSGTVQTLPIAIYSMTKKKVSPEINALSTIMFVVILSIILITNAIESNKEKKIQRAIIMAQAEN